MRIVRPPDTSSVVAGVAVLIPTPPVPAVVNDMLQFAVVVVNPIVVPDVRDTTFPLMMSWLTGLIVRL